MKIFFGKWCVYAHYVASDKDPIYIGKGIPPRAYDCMRYRSDIWYEYVKKNNNVIDVQILGWFDVEDDAFAFEKEQIKKIKPVCNKTHLEFRYPEDIRRRWSETTRKTMTGRHLSEKHKKKISEASKGQKHSAESIARGVQATKKTKERNALLAGLV